MQRYEVFQEAIFLIALFPEPPQLSTDARVRAWCCRLSNLRRWMSEFSDGIVCPCGLGWWFFRCVAVTCYLKRRARALRISWSLGCFETCGFPVFPGGIRSLTNRRPLCHRLVRYEVPRTCTENTFS